MTPLNLPQAKLKLTRKDDIVYVLCPIRKKKLVLTPEEWVRQHIIAYFTEKLNISLGKMASEVSLEYNGLKKRADLVVLNKDGIPEILVECKAPIISLSSSTLFQISTYYQSLPAKILVLTNGLEHHVVNLETKTESRDLTELELFVGSN